jgi:hypothetical protein
MHKCKKKIVQIHGNGFFLSISTITYGKRTHLKTNWSENVYKKFLVEKNLKIFDRQLFLAVKMREIRFK